MATIQQVAMKMHSVAILKLFGLDPSSYDAWNKTAELLVWLGRTMEARICNENIISLNPASGTTSPPGVPTTLPEKSEPKETYIGGLSSPSIKL
ncbi:MAG: hypothetical protein NTV68_07875 [Methanomicrobiales archaeon]|nr:hypothetical protein [Methanomicrobiales archaeon]